jgi:hypothetical protein
MRFLRAIANIFLFAFVMFATQLIGVGAYNLVAIQDNNYSNVGTAEAITLTYSSTSDRVSYWQFYTFWIDDINVSEHQEPHYSVRNWVNNGNWKKGMKWADITNNAVAGVAKSTFAPISDVASIGYFKDIVWDATDPDQKVIDYISEKDTKATKADIIESIKNLDVEDPSFNSSLDYEVFKCYLKVVKYNDEIYGKYSNFYNVDKTTGEIIDVKTSVYVLYAIYYLSIIVAIVFISKYPVTLIQARIVGKHHHGHEDDHNVATTI